jgi:membrane glycosyltransferase
VHASPQVQVTELSALHLQAQLFPDMEQQLDENASTAAAMAMVINFMAVFLVVMSHNLSGRDPGGNWKVMIPATP